MKYYFTVIVFLTINTVFAQTKKSLLDEMKSYRIDQLFNKPINAEFKDLFNALVIVGHQEYPTLVKESESRGFVDFKVESETLQETLSMEILGDKKPYRVSFQVKSQSRQLGYDGKYTPWVTRTNFNEYILKLQYSIYVVLFGSFEYPDDLMERIENYNATQKKDRSKILKGKDY